VIFHSLDFVAFFVITTLVYWRLPRRGQNLFVVAVSYVFYGYIHPWFVALLALTTVTDYTVARAIERYPSRRRALLAITLTTNLGLLGVFKYFNFFAENVQAALAALGWQLSMPVLALILPVGLSFYTFQSLSYVIDVYRGRLSARRSLVDFAAFVSFYPQLVAGPIERASHLLPQIETPRVWAWPVAREAACLMAWGFFKKIVIADNVGVIANKVFSLADPGFTVLWAGVLAFSIQIYADFSAYSDIARGAARWLGFDLMVNFNHPYLASGPVDFWRRWHISLSTWFRDYVYIPLGGSRRGPARALVNLWITFLVSGLWHGASWNYVIWGAYHGSLVAIARITGRRPPSVEPRHEAWAIFEPLRVLGMFLLTCVGWLIFRETDLQMLWRGLTLAPWETTLADRQVGGYLILMTLSYSLPLWIHGIWAVYVTPGLRPRVAGTAWGGWTTTGQALLTGLALAAILVLRSRQSLDFIYFQF
jgi:alginate O-acetyltransferase complex protein AlgI